MTKLTLYLMLILATFHPDRGSSEQLSTDFRDLSAITNIAPPEVAEEVALVLSAFNFLRGGRGHDSVAEYDLAKINFFYASGEDFIIGKRVSKEALILFDDELIAKISRLHTNTDTCYVQNLRLPTRNLVTLVVHNEDNDYEEDFLLCLVAGLWWYSFKSLENFDGLNWRNSFIGLFSDENR